MSNSPFFKPLVEPPAQEQYINAREIDENVENCHVKERKKTFPGLVP